MAVAVAAVLVVATVFAAFAPHHVEAVKGVDVSTATLQNAWSVSLFFFLCMPNQEHTFFFFSCFLLLLFLESERFSQA